MGKAHILIVDDEEDVCTLIQDRLNSLGYDSDYVLNGAEALDYAEQKHPDLILLDIMMPGMDGYEVSRQLIGNKGVSKIPIIMLTAHQSQGSKLKALTMGIDDYITKPFDFDELVARMEAVLRRSKQERGASGAAASSPPRALSPDDEGRLRLLKEMESQKVSSLAPVYDLSSRSAYAYPLAAKIFSVKDGSELRHLEALADRQCFYREFFDKILLCPFCKNYNLNIRETCPACHSPQVKAVEMVHHYRCAYTGVEDEFKQGIDYVCPKCHKELKNIGVDYDKPGQSFFCEACKTLSNEASTEAQCRVCLQAFSVDNALRQNIYSYSITQKGREAIQEGSFGEPTSQDSWMDSGMDVYTLRYLRSLLSQEIKQAEHFKRPLSLLMISIENFKEVLEQKGEVLSRKMMKDFTQIVKEGLRPVDIPASFHENSLVVMMVECDKKQAREIAKSLRTKIEKDLMPQYDFARFALRAASFPEDGNNEEALLQSLLRNNPL